MMRRTTIVPLPNVEPPTEGPLRFRQRSHFVLRYDAIITVVVASAVAFVLGMALQFQLDHAPLPSCTDQIAESGGMCQGPLVD